MTPNHGTNPTDERTRQQAQPTQTPPAQQQRQAAQQQPQYSQPKYTQPQQQQMGGAPQRQQPPQQQTTQAQQQTQPQQQQYTQQQQHLQRQPPLQQTPQTQQQMQPQQGLQTQQPPQQMPQAPAPSESFLKPSRVNQIITEDVVTAAPDTPLPTVVAMMAENDVGSVIVVEEDKPTGIITDRKVALAIEEMPDIAEKTAQDLIDGDITVADPSMSLFDALALMNENSIRRLPIVDDDGTLRGIVTLDDILVLFGGGFGQIAETIEAQSDRI